ncbi:hypothetical protein K502DRAFT_346694 [Neoconidiobolus thromboides FSU 785]|nr:hypothetical protein K502DRAFT_346694 [Neoconidiobolus thromboides FSU 785]
MDRYGLNRDGLCYINEQLQYSNILIFIEVPLVYMLTFVYLLVIAVTVHCKLVKAQIYLNSLASNNTLSSNGFYSPRIRKMLFRISLYPITCALGLSGFIVGYFMVSLGYQRSRAIIIWGMVGITTKGFFSMITFFLDLKIQKASVELYKKIRKGVLLKSIRSNPTPEV